MRIDLVGDGVARVAHRPGQLVHVECAGLKRQRGEGVAQLMEVQAVKSGTCGSWLERVPVEAIGVESVLVAELVVAPPHAGAPARLQGVAVRGVWQIVLPTAHLASARKRRKTGRDGEGGSCRLPQGLAGGCLGVKGSQVQTLSA